LSDVEADSSEFFDREDAWDIKAALCCRIPGHTGIDQMNQVVVERLETATSRCDRITQALEWLMELLDSSIRRTRDAASVADGSCRIRH
jgi:hypothetical protein